MLAKEAPEPVARPSERRLDESRPRNNGAPATLAHDSRPALPSQQHAVMIVKAVLAAARLPTLPGRVVPSFSAPSKLRIPVGRRRPM